ncbi:hypothetical protein [uncultured Desulfobacter sp.]|uniref:hypothetical protein n=1 Tax=uncultured Desulfobacter sp. TaxID=240139 RepID=UPI002AAA7276|nr:hypothetical protein [uncultured Desulfobacter sp.]
MNHATLEQDYGRVIKPEELATFLGVDRRTVIKYSNRWGGIEVSPGKYRFFEKLIRRKIDAQFNNEKRKEKVAGHSNGQWPKKGQIVSRQLKGSLSGSSSMGKGGKSEVNNRTDRHGLLDTV